MSKVVAESTNQTFIHLTSHSLTKASLISASKNIQNMKNKTGLKAVCLRCMGVFFSWQNSYCTFIGFCSLFLASANNASNFFAVCPGKVIYLDGL